MRASLVLLAIAFLAGCQEKPKTVAVETGPVAPSKEIIWFENSGHEPLEEEAGKFNEVVMERIKRK
jgi:pimeloyl-ACP methyl ester carboxylesterase